MNLALFSEISVRDYYDTAVTQQAERRVFNIPDSDLRMQPAQQIIDGILTILSPGRLVLDPVLNEEVRTDTTDRLRIRRWLEFSGSARLLTLRPRQYYATPPRVSLLQAPAAGQAGRVLLEMTVRTLEEKTDFDRYCTSEFAKVLEYAGWVNEDLDHYECGAREWLLTLIDAKITRLRAHARPDEMDGSAQDHAAGKSLPLSKLSSN
ncbi:MAG: hypothetical protein KFF77_04790 [Bacteroidetes bacterium]|nr:hypothetical protein [Bacteroidota bacterium]